MSEAPQTLPDEIRFNPETVFDTVWSWINERNYVYDSWTVVCRVVYHRFQKEPYKEFVVELMPDDGPGHSERFRMIVTRRRLENPPHSRRMDEMEMLAYAWMVCLYVQEAAAQRPYHQPRVELICRVNPLSEVKAEVCLAPFGISDEFKFVF
ncbi:hypothetical protein [Alicyclobacillus macrosporangiidus]|uniref:hypothetical protein n=1 Tax=Alicyclobacillus macrosporangiidus TaxID=392015 RepID=UPI000553A15B|nr:hypothetical protein [Alicyclobacillus macrosporangiidus]